MAVAGGDLTLGRWCGRLAAGLLALGLAGVAPSSLAATAPADEPVPDTVAERSRACTVCHGREGRATRSGYFPRIAGKPAGYLYAQLRHFRDGRRTNAAMAAMLRNLPDPVLREIAEHFASLELPYPAPPAQAVPAGARTQAERLLRDGDAARDLPACAQCHGIALTGTQPATPGLLGLPRDYLLGQFGAWQTGQRQGTSPDCMGEIARKLSRDEVSALALVLSTRAVPPGARPAAAAAPSAATTGPRCAAPEAPPAARLPDPLSEGAKLARQGNCAACHSRPGRPPFSGGPDIVTPFGTVRGGNLTPDPDTGLGRWTPAQFRRALQHGRGVDGRVLVPAFPYANFARVRDTQADALFAWLKSLPPVRAPARPHDLRFPANLPGALRVWSALNFRPLDAQALPPPATVPQSYHALWQRGAELVEGLGHCSACHAARNRWGAPLGQAPRSFGGGVLSGEGWTAPSLWSRAQAGVQDWPIEDIVALLRDGVSPRGSALGPMADVVAASTSHLEADDLVSMAWYLKFLPDETPTQPPPVAPRVLPDPRGEKLYARHCADCHGDRGQGRSTADGRRVYPALAGNRSVLLADPRNALQMIRLGGYPAATAGNPRPFGMPPFLQVLGDDDLAAVLSYVRTAWGNAAAPLRTADVVRLR